MGACPDCGKPAPDAYCWDGRMDCPLEVPPRFLGVTVLYREIRALQKRVAELERRTTLDGGDTLI